tara:strand:+ start:177 stop:509 length:333 start_codon:yes stop_codon:yes gene_type:complete
MSSYKILYWKEIPTQLKFTDSQGDDASYPFSLFFQQAIDAVAMHDGSITTGEYLDAWDWGEIIVTEKSPQEIISIFDSNIPKSFINKIKKIHDEGNRKATPGSIDSWFTN